MKFNDAYIPELGKSATVENIVRAKAEQVAATARTSAPVDTGEYRNSIGVQIVHTPFRVVAKVIANSDHSMLVESKYGTLARALNKVDRG